MQELLDKLEDILEDYDRDTRHGAAQDFNMLQNQIMEEVKSYFLNN